MIFKKSIVFILQLCIFIFQAASVQAWISKGASPSKLVIGLSAYGRMFILSDSSNVNFEDVTSDGGTAGPYNQTIGSVGYNEACILGFL